jgi:hypothetical protein
MEGTGVQFYTINAEYLFKKFRRFSLHLRGGVGFGNFTSKEGYSGDGQPLNFLAIPIGLSAYNFGASNHHVEAGFSIGYVKGTQINNANIQNSSVLLTPSFGYRFQKPIGGIVFKILYTPNIPLHEFNQMRFYAYRKMTRHGIGLCLGYSFRKR